MTDTGVTNDVFTETTPVAPSTNETTTTTPSTPEYTGTVAELVGEGKKFKTLEALAASVAHKDEFIETLKTEKQEVQDRFEKASKSEEVFNKLLETKEKTEVVTPTASMSPEEIQKLVADSISKTKSQEVAVANIKEANDTLVEKYGDLTKARDFLGSKAKELGLSVEFLMSTAAKSPTAFLNVLGVSATKPTENNSVITGTVNTEAKGAFSTEAKAGSEAYFKAMYKADPKKYMSPEIQKAIARSVENGTY